MLGGLPRRDLWLLPLVAFATLLLLAFISEVAARVIWPDQERDACEKADSSFRPNCASWVKIAEGPWLQYRYNDCSARADRPCAKLPGERRVAVVGSSISAGYWVPFAQTFAGRLEKTLDPVCPGGMDVQTETEGAPGGGLAVDMRQVPAALAMHPDVMVTVTAPYDLERFTPRKQAAAPAPPGLFSMKGIKAGLAILSDSRAAHMAQHFLYLDLARYLPLYLEHGDGADFMRPPFTPAWMARLNYADRAIGQMADRAHAAGVPLIVVFLPNRPETALAAAPERGIDPFALPEAVGRMVRRHGAFYVDLTRAAARMNAPNTLFYPVDGHPTAAGHALIAKALAPLLVAKVPAFRRCTLKHSEAMAASGNPAS